MSKNPSILRIVSGGFTFLFSFWLCGFVAEAETATNLAGTWNVAIHGKYQGAAVLTFSNLTVSGYGMTLSSTGLFAISGSYALDPQGKRIVMTLDGAELTGTFLCNGRQGKRFAGKRIAPKAGVVLAGAPTTTLPQQLDGAWTRFTIKSGLASSIGNSTLAPTEGGAAGTFGFEGLYSLSDTSTQILGVGLVLSNRKIFTYEEWHTAAGVEFSLASQGVISANWQRVRVLGTTSTGVGVITMLQKGFDFPGYPVPAFPLTTNFTVLFPVSDFSFTNPPVTIPPIDHGTIVGGAVIFAPYDPPVIPHLNP